MFSLSQYIIDINFEGDVQLNIKKSALKSVSLLPLALFICFIGLAIYLRSIGGYRSLSLKEENVK